MKQLKILFILLILPSILFSQEISIPLHDDWSFKQSDEDSWLPAEVPGTAHTDLLNNGKIEDPFYRMNEKKQQWIEHEDWEYISTFEANTDIISKDKIALIFHGLDTYADVFLNDSLILKANNMFRSWEVDVEGIIQKGDNNLRIYFHSPTNKTEPFFNSLGYTIPVSSNDQADKKVSIFTRKAPYHFGWDWGPRFVTSGIWRPIELRAWDTAILKEVMLEQKSLSENNATLLASIELEVTRPLLGELEILVDGESIKKSMVDLKLGIQHTNLSFSIANPELWWPNGLGAQKLYEIEIQLKKIASSADRDEILIDSKKVNSGLRTIELVQEDDRHGASFYFKVNGLPVFMKGANYIPQDNFLTRVDEQRYEHILQSAADANMNMIRVWGGGIYENDLFYKLCDEKGLLVWQDFMFSCAMYPGDEAFLENVKTEAVENVKRLRQHPSLALWCGNNEILMKWSGWRKNANEEGNQVPLWSNPEDSLKIVSAYDDIFKDILPSAVDAHGQGVPYWESSPMAKGGRFDDWKSGDSHYWGVWWGQEPFESYRKNIGRFMSEFGFQSFPEFNTIKSFTTNEDWDIYSDVMQAHQRSSIGNKTIANYLGRHFNEPTDFKSFLYVSQFLQAEGMKVAMEAHRIAKPYNMGSLIWQLDDCWPVASWSSIDYYGRWKALHYYAKKTFSETIIAFERDENELKIHGITDSHEEIKANLIVELLDMNGKNIITEEKKIKIKGNSSQEIWKGSIKDLLKKQKSHEVYLRAKLVHEGLVLFEQVYLFEAYKDLALEVAEIKYDFIEEGDNLFIELKSNKTAFGVCFETGDLDLLFDDNYFTLHAKEDKRIEVLGKFEPFEVKNKLTVKSLIDSYTE